MIGVMDAIAALIMDMTMVAMIVPRTTMTTLAATLRVMVPRLRQGDAGGGITRYTMEKLKLDGRSWMQVYYYFFSHIFAFSYVLVEDVYARIECTDDTYDFTIFTQNDFSLLVLTCTFFLEPNVSFTVVLWVFSLPALLCLRIHITLPCLAMIFPYPENSSILLVFVHLTLLPRCRRLSTE
jgi:hypothetical protein